MRKIEGKKPFGLADKVGYLFGDFGCNMSFQLVTSYLMLFVTQGLGISVAHWAIIVIIAKIFDAINDPIIGAIVDARVPSKNGKFRPWIFWGAFAIAITTALLFLDVRQFVYWGRFSYVLLLYMIWSIAYTSANVPYGSLNAVLTDDPGERASLSSLRSIGSSFATLPIMILMPLIAFDTKDVNGFAPLKPEIFVWVALVCGVIGLIGFMCTYFLTTERTEHKKSVEKFNYFKTLGAFFKNKPALAISLASFAQVVFILSYGVTLPLVFQFYFLNTKIISVATVIVTLPIMILIPFMSKMSVKFGKKEISTFPNILAIAVLIIMLLINFPRNNVGAWLYSALLGIAMFAGGTFTLATWSMVADCVDQQEINTGKREEASVYATYSLARKIAQGVGASLVSICLSIVGYNTKDVAINTDGKISNGILKLSIILPLIGFCIIFLVLLFLYDLNRAKVEENTKFLREKHERENCNKDNQNDGMTNDTDLKKFSKTREISNSVESAFLNENIQNSMIMEAEDDKKNDVQNEKEMVKYDEQNEKMTNNKQ